MKSPIVHSSYTLSTDDLQINKACILTRTTYPEIEQNRTECKTRFFTGLH